MPGYRDAAGAAIHIGGNQTGRGGEDQVCKQTSSLSAASLRASNALLAVMRLAGPIYAPYRNPRCDASAVGSPVMRILLMMPSRRSCCAFRPRHEATEDEMMPRPSVGTWAWQPMWR